MEEGVLDPCEKCPYDNNGWCSCEGDLPNDALCMGEYEDGYAFDDEEWLDCVNCPENCCKAAGVV